MRGGLAAHWRGMRKVVRTTTEAAIRYQARTASTFIQYMGFPVVASSSRRTDETLGPPWRL